MALSGLTIMKVITRKTRREDDSDPCEGIILGDGLEDEPFEYTELAVEARFVITDFFNFE